MSAVAAVGVTMWLKPIRAWVGHQAHVGSPAPPLLGRSPEPSARPESLGGSPRVVSRAAGDVAPDRRPGSGWSAVARQGPPVASGMYITAACTALERSPGFGSGGRASRRRRRRSRA